MSALNLFSKNLFLKIIKKMISSLSNSISSGIREVSTRNILVWDFALKTFARFVDDARLYHSLAFAWSRCSTTISLFMDFFRVHPSAFSSPEMGVPC